MTSPSTSCARTLTDGTVRMTSAAASPTLLSADGLAGRPRRRASTRRRGKSGLHRARWWVTPTRGDPRESATENRPPDSPEAGKGETVVQETTSDPGDRAGSANPTRSKIKKSGAFGHRTHARSRAARPSAWVDRRRVSATAPVDGWSPTGSREGPGDRTRLTGQPVRTTPLEWRPVPKGGRLIRPIMKEKRRFARSLPISLGPAYGRGARHRADNSSPTIRPPSPAWAQVSPNLRAQGIR